MRDPFAVRHSNDRAGHRLGYAPDDYCVSVVIPTLNEAEHRAHVLPGVPPWVHDVILVEVPPRMARSRLLER